jgi:uncharacterized protein with ParB-like and HNH nuclease domain
MSPTREIAATEDTVNGLLSRNYRYIVPEYQRQYSWGEEQWVDLWRDIRSVEQGHTHFLGSVVFIEKHTEFDQLNQYEIVDGQQRLTTISILLCAIRKYYKGKENDEAAESIDNNYLWEEDENFNEKQKLELNKLDQAQYRRLLLGNPPREEESNIRRAIDFFSDKIFSLTPDEVDDIRKKLLNSVTLVTIDCPNQESAFRLFETLNDRGLELSEVDLMKNYLYKKAVNNSGINEEAIKQDWEDIIDSIRYEMKKPFRFFIHYFLFAPTPDISTNISQNTLYETFQELIDEDIPESEITLEQYLSRMAEDTILYLNMMNAEVSKFDSTSNNRINELLFGLDRLGYTQERTYLMGLLYHLDSASEVIRGIKLIEAHIIRQRFTKNVTGSDLNELYAEICRDAFTREDPIRYIQSQLRSQAPSDDELEAAITGNEFPRSQRTLFLLERIEADQFRGSSHSQVPSGEIEHIIPRKAYSAKKYNSWQDYLKCGKAEFNENKDKLGNLTILEQRLNLEASDRPFEQKKAKYRGSDYLMSNGISEYDEWSIEIVQQRTEELAEMVSDTWNFKV